MEKREGLLIVCEGLDGAGKTTTIEKLLENSKDDNFVYSKGMGSYTFIGKFARKHPSTVLFLLELVYNQYKIIKPNLKKEKTILQDRYDISVLSYPTAERFYNKIIAKILSPLIIKPDALVYFDVSLEERIKRLEKEKYNKYHLSLSKNPQFIVSRENKYLYFYNQFKKPKTKIDTTNINEKQAAKILEKFILAC